MGATFRATALISRSPPKALVTGGAGLTGPAFEGGKVTLTWDPAEGNVSAYFVERRHRRSDRMDRDRRDRRSKPKFSPTADCLPRPGVA